MNMIRKAIGILRKDTVLPQAQTLMDELRTIRPTLNGGLFARSGVYALNDAILKMGDVKSDAFEMPVDAHLGIIDTDRPRFDAAEIFGRDVSEETKSIAEKVFRDHTKSVTPLSVFVKHLERHSDVLARHGLIVFSGHNERGEDQNILTFSAYAKPDTLGAVLRERATAQLRISGPGLG